MVDMNTFITDNDYKLVIGDKALDAVSQVSSDIREMAETEAVEEISSYLRGRYDVETIFSKTGSDRNPQIVMYACDIALFHMSASLPQRIGASVREDRYKRAQEWLDKVAQGDVIPDLPVDEGAATSMSPIVIKSERKLQKAW